MPAKKAKPKKRKLPKTLPPKAKRSLMAKKKATLQRLSRRAGRPTSKMEKGKRKSKTKKELVKGLSKGKGIAIALGSLAAAGGIAGAAYGIRRYHKRKAEQDVGIDVLSDRGIGDDDLAGAVAI